MTMDKHKGTKCTDNADIHLTEKELLDRIRELEVQLDASRTKLQETEEFYSGRLNNLNDVLFTVDENGYFTYLNSAIRNITGYEIEEVLGTHFTKHVHPDDIPGLLQDIEKTVAGEHKPYMFRIVKKKGDISYVHTTSRPIIEDGEYKGINGLMVDIARLKHVEFKLMEERDRAQKYLDIVGVIILVLDREGNIKLINKKGAQIFNCKESDIISKNWFELAMPDDLKEVAKKGYAKLIRKEIEPMPYFEAPIRVQEETRIFAWHNIMMRDEEGNITEVISSGEDITDKKKAEEALVFAKLLSENVNRTKKQFLSNVSHELRTPLNLIMGYSDLLYEDYLGQTNDEQKKYLDVIKKSGNRLLLLINSMIELSAAEEGKLELNIKEVSAPAIVKDIKNSTLPMAKKKHIKLDFELENDITVIHIDKNKLKTILYNLINNAIKFTPEMGEIKVTISREKDMLKFSVKDTGIGIDEKDLDKLFQPFLQIDPALTRRYEGVGLGLMIVKRFVEMHGGNIQVSSEPDKGSDFTFTIPENYEI
ncbi:PAS domain-containing sensor histidine kinase [Methanolobus sp. WCC4]|uniref:PAS domain-containing sensor histidine kinase n=1 Tax=Methanolobus sp. WCC4 TaxID=3125784 RepID=UPI0030F58E24